MLICLLVAAAGENHADRDCFAVAVLSHGDDGVLYGVDKIITIENFIAPIKSCPSLVGKPKLFIFQVGHVTRVCVLSAPVGFKSYVFSSSNKSSLIFRFFM